MCGMQSTSANKTLESIFVKIGSKTPKYHETRSLHLIVTIQGNDCSYRQWLNVKEDWLWYKCRQTFQRGE